MNVDIIKNMIDIVGEDYVLLSPEQIKGYFYDETELVLRPEANEDCIVVKPVNTEEVAKIVKYANEVEVSVVVRGGGTGLCGACIPSNSSIIISMERFKKILELDEDNFDITVEAGVTLSELIEHLSQNSKLYFPVHPGDESAHVAGMVTENAGGARAVKHGIMRNHIKGLEVVTAKGEVMQLGGKLSKNNAGYNLMQLVIGSEGTLCIVTKVILKIYPKEDYSATLVISFDTLKDAVKVVPKILQSGVTPLAMEYVERFSTNAAAEHLGVEWPAKKGNVDIVIMLSENNEDKIYENCETIAEICEESGCVETLIADNAKDQARILNIRSNTYTATKHMLADSMDATVPPVHIPEFMEETERIATEKYNTRLVTVGHIGDGNMHNTIMLENGKLPDYYEDFKNDIYKAALKYGGTITGEHGVGKIRKNSLKLQISDAQLEIMKNIKKAFDPKNILNPSTIFDM